jgi:hypothetical protein
VGGLFIFWNAIPEPSSAVGVVMMTGARPADAKDAAARRYNRPELTAGPRPNRKLMLRMLCFPKKPLYSHHLPVLDLLSLA